MKVVLARDRNIHLHKFIIRFQGPLSDLIYQSPSACQGDRFHNLWRNTKTFVPGLLAQGLGCSKP
ncbi:hypothetical protein DPMN_126138 [Dreissena polymorpha]|uniref:Uncharacterized protein n=1 Tax=Dreissena polymorpha TaxID=45954 RepID=A0A9D4GVJ8_DREPO|nr:hypothetical protein DPMN_126138 [Dreissena polymorpha]